MPGLAVVYPPNITPDPETGIGSWSNSDIVHLLKTGETPDGREVAEIMAWRSYAIASDADLQAIATYLKSIRPVQHAVPGPTALDDVKTPYITIAKHPD